MIVNWTDFAREKLYYIHETIAEKSTIAADKAIKKIINRSEQIGNFPQSGRKVPEYNLREIREVLDRPYQIIYRVMPEQIDILTVMHYRQLLSELLEAH
jgi:plasmid stabilization system protein ParE